MVQELILFCVHVCASFCLSFCITAAFNLPLSSSHQVAAHVMSFKYLYKYVLKPPDSAAVVIDEISAYLQGRMLSASEAVFRILSLRLHAEWPPVLCLDIHLPNHERMVFDPMRPVDELLMDLHGENPNIQHVFRHI